MLRPHRLHLVLFAQLAAFGCAAPDATPPTTTTSAPAPPIAATPAPPTTTAPTATTTTAPSTPIANPPQKVGDVCSNDVSCPAPLTCQLGFDGAQFSPTGTCVEGRVIYEGRPLLVDGTAHTAAHVVVDTAPVVVHDDALASVLLHAAFEEHASIASFARTVLSLMQLGAPLSLIAATQAALADEIRHADDVLAAAVAHGATPVVFGALPAATAPFADDVARALLDDVLVGGCIGETLSAFRVEARGTAHPSIAALCARIADDEARHAALAFATARFVLGVRPELRDVVDAAFADFCSTGSVDDVACVAPAWRVAFGA